MLVAETKVNPFVALFLMCDCLGFLAVELKYNGFEARQTPGRHK